MESLYKSPKYYEMAFSFRDIPREVDLFEEAIKRYASIPVARVLEIGCGPAPHAEELASRGYEYLGLDLSREMIDYVMEKSKKGEGSARGSIKGFIADMIDFDLDEPVDFAFIPLGSLFAKHTADLKSHFNAMGRALKKGGLYLLDWCVEFDAIGGNNQEWEMEAEGIHIKTSYATRILNRVEQVFEETIILDVDDHGAHREIQDLSIRRAIFPQEFLLFIAGHPAFDFIGWWNNWDLANPLGGGGTISRPVIILKRV
ncbi:MAG: class I SAM-dependent methyltransferase [Candidatus Eisenbacteria bacterium]|uniref:Class I SAM-dependent methyltransferase n=1 Tax=Eiseniibacteriota bacterium TaxID=2212470 RepID=A0A948RXS7_UNCEI|nr:class I SAM-dependent methyltransferase [Candidatus Eisenbacteria bacterium]MBU1948876.1 class I SAM-dependent methyltransferase [Candidatus Eisenbacteria bacterium]MBU2691559.1 class I SAM-dependent methyltransferase [Candidatus Eisenbacteria bacterium]